MAELSRRARAIVEFDGKPGVSGTDVTCFIVVAVMALATLGLVALIIWHTVTR